MSELGQTRSIWFCTEGGFLCVFTVKSVAETLPHATAVTCSTEICKNWQNVELVNNKIMKRKELHPAKFIHSGTLVHAGLI